MASRVIEFDNKAFHAQRLAQPVAGPVLEESLSDAVLSVEDTERNSGRNFAKGCFAGLGLEVLGAMAMYGVWELWHVFR